MNAEPKTNTEEASLTDNQIAAWLLERLGKAPECTSELARELVYSSRDVERVLLRLREAGLIESRKHRCQISVRHEADEIRWGLVS